MSERPYFHLAFPVRNLAEARAFHGDPLGCPQGRSSGERIDFDSFGHQVASHLSPKDAGHKDRNDADGEQAMFFFFNPSGNAPEFKAFHDEPAIFAH